MSTKKLQILDSLVKNADTLDGKHANEFASVGDLEGLATETFVANKIAEAQLSGGDGEIDLSGYATKDDLDTKLPLTGGTLTGNLTIANSNNYSYLYLANSAKEKIGGLYASDSENRLYLINHSPNSTAEKYEGYALPASDEGLTGNKWHSILTSKNPVTIKQGGTGATDAAAARTNIGAAALNHTHKYLDTYSGTGTGAIGISDNGFWVRVQRENAEGSLGNAEYLYMTKDGQKVYTYDENGDYVSTLLSNVNYKDYALPISGGTVAGNISINKGTEYSQLKLNRTVDDVVHSASCYVSSTGSVRFDKNTGSTAGVNYLSLSDTSTTLGKPLALGSGGTGATNAATARKNIGAASTASYSATLKSTGWSSSAPYSQTVSVSGILATDDPLVYVDMSGATTAAKGIQLTDAWYMVGRVTANAGSITAYCYEEKPTIDVPLVLKVVR